MKKTLIALAAVTAAATGLAVPAVADTRTATIVRVDYDYNRRDDRIEHRLDSRIDNLYDRIRAGRRTGDLSRVETDRLLRRLDSIAAERRRAERTGRGLSPREAASLNDRLDRLSREVRFERHDRDGRRW